MSMLAGPRRKQKVINLRAKNNAWSNDTNKFGQRMLEKMGWSAGKGLGANENGIVEHVIAKYKNDEKGLGFEDKNDQWTKHEDDFNSLLANLSNNSENNADTLHSGVSLEVKSKKSKARIHYHKYTRGKDLSRYSEKDLANIFGKKSFKEETVEEPLKDEVNVTEKKFTEKGNMDDYFKSKLASLKIRSKLLSNDNNEKEDVDYGFQGFSLQPPGEGENQDDQDSEILENEPEKAVKSKKKKKSKQKDNMGEKCDSLQVNEMSDQLSVEETLPVKQKKLKKKKLQDVDSEIIENNEVKKKKSKRNQECVSQDDDSLQNHIESVDNNIPKKKKKRKNKE